MKWRSVLPLVFSFVDSTIDNRQFKRQQTIQNIFDNPLALYVRPFPLILKVTAAPDQRHRKVKFRGCGRARGEVFKLTWKEKLG
jgi:hypothetical protein